MGQNTNLQMVGCFIYMNGSARLQWPRITRGKIASISIGDDI